MTPNVAVVLSVAALLPTAPLDTSRQPPRPEADEPAPFFSGEAIPEPQQQRRPWAPADLKADVAGTLKGPGDARPGLRMSEEGGGRA